MMRDYVMLSKPRISVFVIITAAMGYCVGGGETNAALLWLCLGTGLTAAACGCLNQALEGVQDSKMARTAKRPVAAGRVSPLEASLLGGGLAVAGLAILWAGCGPLPFWITIFGYVALYTPLKMVTPQTTWIGAAAGATSPMIGWAAARGSLGVQAWSLFAIQFLWQIPHFLSLFWMYREDYSKAGFQVMPVVDPKGGVTAAQIAMHSFTVLPAALLPMFLGMAGKGYGFAALALSAAYLGFGLKASWSLAPIDTRRLFLASLAYLPLLFASLLIGGV